jgi:hypothetical protein
LTVSGTAARLVVHVAVAVVLAPAVVPVVVLVVALVAVALRGAPLHPIERALGHDLPCLVGDRQQSAQGQR